MRGRVPAGLRYWFMGGTLHFRPEGKHDQFAGEGTLEMRDMRARLADMDRMGVDVQVIFSTMFLLLVLPDPEWQMAMARAYNRWIADCCSADPTSSPPRKRCAAPPPTSTRRARPTCRA